MVVDSAGLIASRLGGLESPFPHGPAEALGLLPGLAASDVLGEQLVRARRGEDRQAARVARRHGQPLVNEALLPMYLGISVEGDPASPRPGTRTGICLRQAGSLDRGRLGWFAGIGPGGAGECRHE